MTNHSCVEVPTLGPVVSFELRVGEKVPKGQVIDFDDTAFRKLCEQVAPDIIDAGDDLSIIITADRIGHKSYDPSDVVISAGFRGKVRKTNQVIAHETKHYLDHQRAGLRSGIYQTLGDGGSVAVMAGAGAVLCAMAAVPYRADIALVAGAASSLLAGGGLLGLAAYRFGPDERSARAAEREYSDLEFLTLRPASDYMLAERG